MKEKNKCMICVRKGVMRFCKERRMSLMTKILDGCKGCRYNDVPRRF